MNVTSQKDINGRNSALEINEWPKRTNERTEITLSEGLIELLNQAVKIVY